MAVLDAPVAAAQFAAAADLIADGGLAELLGPLLAGARARGVADGLELLGVAAVLMDGTGRVLHASGRAQRALGPLVRIVEHHLVGSDSLVNDALQSLVADAVRTLPSSAARAGVALRGADGQERLRIRAVSVPARDGEVQLLRSILIIDEVA